MRKRFLATLLALVMVLGMLPAGALAAEMESDFGPFSQDDESEIAAAAASSTDIAYPVTGGNIYFNAKTGAVTDCDESVTAANIPSTIQGTAVTQIGDSAFNGCNSLTSVTIPNSVTSIGNEAFYRCINLASVTIPDSVTSIGKLAFNDCVSLTSAGPIGGGYSYEFGWTDKIPAHAFQGCGRLTSVTIPDSVTSIGDHAFYNCDSLPGVTIPNSVTSIGDAAFFNCSLRSVTIPDSVTDIGDYVFYGCSRLTSVTIPDSVTSIGDSAFYGCSRLPGVTIPDSVTSIGRFAFYDCSGLTSVTIPDSVTSIGEWAFNACIGLTSVTISNSVTSIERNAFSNCISLPSVTIPNSVTSIGDNAFYNCESLTIVTIPNSVTSIGSNAFTMWKSLADVYYGGSEAQWAAIQIGSNNELLENATIHYNSNTPGPNDPPVVGDKLTEWEADFLKGLYELADVNVTADANEHALHTYFNKSTIDDIDRAVTLWRAVQESGIAGQMESVPNELQIDCVMTEGRYKDHSATLIFRAKSAVDHTAMFKGISVVLINNETGAALVEEEPYAAQAGASPQKFADGIQNYLKAECGGEFVKFCKKLGKDAIKASVTGIETLTGDEYLNAMMDIYKNIDIVAENAKEYGYTGNASKIVQNPFDAAASDGEKTDQHTTKKTGTHCPVDVYVYNPAGELCGAVEKDVITVDTTETFIRVTGSEKDIWMNDNYRIKMVATGEGSMNYSIQEYAGIEETRAVYFDDVPLSVGVTYEGNVPGELGVPVTEYSLTSNTGAAVQANRVTGGSQPGDLDGDGKITMLDVLRLARAVAGSVTLTEAEQRAGDLDGDGKITMLDVLRLARAVAGSVTLTEAE